MTHGSGMAFACFMPMMLSKMSHRAMISAAEEAAKPPPSSDNLPLDTEDDDDDDPYRDVPCTD